MHHPSTIPMISHLPTSRRKALSAIGAAVALSALGDFRVRGDEPAPATLQRTFTYKKVEIKADVYRLPGDDVRPVIVWIHGGALILGHRGMLDADQRQLYLQAGYVVVAIDYRLAPETKLPAIVEDVRDACQWVRNQGPKLF